MSILNTIIHWNSLLCPPIGFVLNFALIWLIFRATPKEMFVHSRILLQTCFIDIALLAVQFVGQPVFIVFNAEFTLTIFDGYLIATINPSPNWMAKFSEFWYFLHMFDIFGVAVQFIYRYFVLNRDFRIGFCRYCSMLLVLFFICAILVGCKMPVYSIGDLNDEIAKTSPIFKMIEQNLEKPFIYSFHNIEQNDWIGFYVSRLQMPMHISLFYAIIIFCGYKMSHFINKHSNFNGRIKALNRQLTLNLIILASIPFLFMAFYMAFSISNQLGVNFPARLISTFLIAWLPVLNPLITIFVNQPYKKAIKRKLAFLKRTQPTTLISTIQVKNLKEQIK